MVLTDSDFDAVRAHLRAAAGLAFDESRRAALSATFAERLEQTDTATVADYLRLLALPDSEHERHCLLDAVTVRETSFFRNGPQMEALRRHLLPDLLRETSGRDRPLTIWSAGCSTGEEAYTLGMLLLELAPALVSPSTVRILGTDVSTEALRAASRATYAGRTLEALPPTLADRWTEARPGGARGVLDRVRRLVELRLHNLVAEPPPFGRGEVDLVVCRNVTIYFDRETTSQVVGTFHDVLRGGGYLLLGHAETLWQLSDAFELVPAGEAFAYRRGADAARTPARRPRRPPRPVAPGPAPAPVPLDLARSAVAEGRYDVAARAAAEAVTADPLNPSGYLLLGQARVNLAQPAAAVESLRKAVYLDPALAPAHFLLGGALAALGRHDQAAVSYRAAARSLTSVVAGTFTDFLSGRGPEEMGRLCEQLALQQEQTLAGGGAA